MQTRTKLAASMVLLAAMTAHGEVEAPLLANSGALPPIAQTETTQRAHEMIASGLRYLKSQQKEDGSWQNKGEPPAITAIVLKAFAQEPTYSPTRDDFLKKGYDKLLSFQLADGGIYTDLLANYNTSIAVSALAAAKNPD